MRSPLLLTTPRPHHALADGRARFGAQVRAQELARRLSGDQDLQIDAIADRSGQSGPVALSLERRAFADSARVAGKTTGAGIGRRHQDEAGRQNGVPARAGHRQPPLFERLPEGLERVATEFRDLVHEEHATVRPGDFTGPGRGPAAADQGRR